MKTNPLKRLKLPLMFFLFASEARAYNAFECLRELLPITDRAAIQRQRADVEEPFLVNDQFMAFPEVSNRTVSGFYFYGVKKAAAYYDAVEFKGAVKSIGDLTFAKDDGIYELVGQPSGLETVTVSFLPGFGLGPTGKNGPVMLGASVLPVFGAFVSRPEMSNSAYSDPQRASEGDVKKWMAKGSSDRRPAGQEPIKINKTILRLKTIQAKTADELWKPFKQELKLRKAWIQTHNLDEKAFKQLSLVMEGNCKE